MLLEIKSAEKTFCTPRVPLYAIAAASLNRPASGFKGSHTSDKTHAHQPVRIMLGNYGKEVVHQQVRNPHRGLARVAFHPNAVEAVNRIVPEVRLLSANITTVVYGSFARE